MVVPPEFGENLPILALNVAYTEEVLRLFLLTDLGSLGGKILILILRLPLLWRLLPLHTVLGSSGCGNARQRCPQVLIEVGDCNLLRQFHIGQCSLLHHVLLALQSTHGALFHVHLL